MPYCKNVRGAVQLRRSDEGRIAIAIRHVSVQRLLEPPGQRVAVWQARRRVDARRKAGGWAGRPQRAGAVGLCDGSQYGVVVEPTVVIPQAYGLIKTNSTWKNCLRAPYQDKTQFISTPKLCCILISVQPSFAVLSSSSSIFVFIRVRSVVGVPQPEGALWVAVVLIAGVPEHNCRMVPQPPHLCPMGPNHNKNNKNNLQGRCFLALRLFHFGEEHAKKRVYCATEP